MRNLVLIIILTLVAAAAFSGEPIREEASMKANSRLEVSNVAGSVEITGWSRKNIEVTGELGDDSILVFEVSGDTARVEIEYDNKGHKKRYNREDTDLVIYVPHSTRVSATTVSADLTVLEIKGAQRLRTVSGDLQTQVSEQDAVVKSVSGEIEVDGDGGRAQLTVASVSGDVDVRNVAGEIDAKTVSGDVELVGSDFTRLEMETVSGDVDFRGKLEAGGRIDAESVSGDILLELDSLYNCEYFLESFSGDIRPIMNLKSVKTSKYAPGSKLELIEGDGESRIRVETMSGDVDITATKEAKRKPKVRQTSGTRYHSDHDFEASMEELVHDMEELSHDAQKMAIGELHDLDIDID